MDNVTWVVAEMESDYDTHQKHQHRQIPHHSIFPLHHFSIVHCRFLSSFFGTTTFSFATVGDGGGDSGGGGRGNDPQKLWFLISSFFRKQPLVCPYDRTALSPPKKKTRSCFGSCSFPFPCVFCHFQSL